MPLGRLGGAAAAITTALVAALLAGPAVPASATTGPGDCRAAASFTQARFPARPDVDNRWFPLKPGSRFELSGTMQDAGSTHRHSITSTVTGLTKVLHGVRTVVLLEQDFDNGELQESELAFMAEDSRGAVWNVGEYPEEYSDGRLDGAPSTWIEGIAGARAGIGMLAHPALGSAAYLQGTARSVGFRDCAQVARTGVSVCVPTGCYHHVLVTREWDPQDPAGGIQLKYSAPGVGTVLVRALGGDQPENLRLTGLHRLRGSALRAVDALALRQDARGYRVSPDVYGRTPRAVAPHH
ncbi:MAG: hypothetical protein ACTHJL_12830 [Amnibacterium sp.]